MATSTSSNSSAENITVSTHPVSSTVDTDTGSGESSYTILSTSNVPFQHNQTNTSTTFTTDSTTLLNTYKPNIPGFSSEDLRGIKHNNTVCYIPDKLDTIYFTVSKLSRFRTFTDNRCPPIVTITKSIFTEPSNNDTYDKLCFPKVDMSSEIISPTSKPQTTRPCPYLIKGMSIEEDCYCDRPYNLNISSFISCLCNIKGVDISNPHEPQTDHFYVKKNCTIFDKNSTEPNKWISNCTLSVDKTFSFNDTYFKNQDSTRINKLEERANHMYVALYHKPEAQLQYIVGSVGQKINDPLSTNLLSVLLLLTFHLFVYYGLFKK